MQIDSSTYEGHWQKDWPDHLFIVQYLIITSFLRWKTNPTCGFYGVNISLSEPGSRPRTGTENQGK